VTRPDDKTTRSLPADPAERGDAAPPISGTDRLAQRAGHGDQDALRAFLEGRARSVTRRYRGAGSAARHADTHDILATVFVRTVMALRRRPLSADSAGGLWRLVERIAERAGLRTRRKASRGARALSRLPTPATGPSPQTGPDVRALLDSLPPIDREIARLVVTGLTHAQIAEQLGISEPAVRQRWSRLRARLRGDTRPSLPG
jgi:DNA-directed RNA polymerase specialized sigma24 family protein